MTTFDLNLVGTFVKVAETGSFTAAAQSLGLPKSSVSRGIARLEESLGVRLLQRTTRRLALTEAGRRYFETSRAALASLAEASRSVADEDREPRGLVRLTIPPDFGDGLITDVLARFLARHPGISIDLIVSGRHVNLIEEGVDLAVRAGRLDDSSLVARRIVVSELRLYAAPRYLAERGRPTRLAELRREAPKGSPALPHAAVLFRGRDGVIPWRLTGPRGLEQIEPPAAMTVDDLPTLRRLVAAGVGIGLLPAMTVHGDVVSGALVRVLPAYAVAGAAVHIVSPPLRHVPARVALLREHLITELTKLLLPCRSRSAERPIAEARS